MGKPSSMDAKYKDDLFRKYVQFHESQGDATPGSDESLRAAASTLLSLHKVDPCYRFRLIQFYEVVESALRSLRSSSLRALRCAFSVLETVGVNLFLCPWKKEFRSIKTYTGPFVYYVKSTLLEEDIRAILSYMGYMPELGTAYRLKELVETLQVKMVSFELFLAKVECEQMLEIHSQVKDKGYTELDVVSERRGSAEDARGCAEALRRRAEAREPLSASMARVVLQKSASERAAKDYYKPRVTKPSRSVDTYDSYWESRKPPLKTSLSLRKEPAAAEPGDELKDEIVRPPPSLLTVAGSSHGGADDLPAPAPSNGLGLLRGPYLPGSDDVDLYTDAEPRAAYRRQDALRPDVWLLRNDAHPGYHKRSPPAKESALSKCQNCGLSCSAALCQRCDSLLACSPAAKPSAFPGKASGHDSLAHGAALREKYAGQTQGLERPPHLHSKSKPPTAAAATSRCGFCNRPGAANTCTQCSKVSCDACLSAYHYDPCCKKSELHKFMPNNQLNYKSTQFSHLVYR
ncbi:spermatogenesis-associated protein 2 [Bubalus kerabau]|uniref:spermatogenesis-associated protein 2 n=1 Tax=Bubalus carabanensis TaxID=3119969 RepID=UPI00244EA042|nr:spermatogenesis-associated protein 2 [Bubalus carabanensis]XP_055401260.1 spermatogenesis-associated protein 2 [Bubalus carabanensis]XP_055401261.1 spermatogenesis-associated protein 2 [Bubalus carabanensis]XP_055401262.1 spermatogenesis-associated protein 2 [Bubalus carabanensis]XP_055401263.1 spermatogenesis-associated protein 2 [Bubalus carabanensis]XP_055401264.1 spermatogenesis-associated protein 2 [Bubalus carabanensis]